MKLLTMNRPNIKYQMIFLGILGCSLWLASTHGFAEVYKQTQADGGVIFTDQPKETLNDAQKAEKVKIAKPSIIPSVKVTVPVRSSTTASKEITKRPNFQIKIVSPSKQGHYHNSQGNALAFQTSSRPKKINKKNLKVTLDGSEIELIGNVLPYLNRGEHHLKAEIISSKGKLLASDTVTFYVHRTSVLFRNRAEEK